MESKQVPWLGRSSHTVGNRSKVCKWVGWKGKGLPRGR